MINQFVRKLRVEQTDAEHKLWDALRNRQISHFKFRRQHPIGPYIVDFYCAERGLVIEVDGGQHAQGILKDQKRTDYLTQMGCRVLRFWDHEVLLELDSVLEAIRLVLNDPHPHPLPKREREQRPVPEGFTRRIDG